MRSSSLLMLFLSTLRGILICFCFLLVVIINKVDDAFIISAGDSYLSPHQSNPYYQDEESAFKSTDHPITADRIDDTSDVHPFRVSVTYQIGIHILTKLPNGTYDFQGYGSLIFKWLARKLNRPLVLVVPSEEAMKKEGFIRSTTNLVINEEADISAVPITADPDQLGNVDLCTYPVIIGQMKMIVPAGQEESRLFAFVRRFQSTVWLFFAISLICSLIAATTISWLYARRMKRNCQQHDDERTRSRSRRAHQPSLISFSGIYCMHTISIITAHGCRNPFNRNGLRIFGALFLLVITILVYGYSGLLISCLTVATYTKPIDTLEEVVASKDVVLFIAKEELALGGLSKMVMDGKSGVWKALAEQLRRRPDGFYPARPLTEKDFAPEHQNYATPVLGFWSKWMISRLYKKEKKCRFHQSKPLPFFARYYYPTKKNGGEDNKLVIYEGMMAMWEYGLLDHWVEEAFHIPGAEKCFVKEKSTKKAAIKLIDLTGAFLILGIGLGLATLCFLIERIVFVYQRGMKEMQQEQCKSVMAETVKVQSPAAAVVETAAVVEAVVKIGKIVQSKITVKNIE